MSTKNFNDFLDSSRKDIWRYAKLLGATETCLPKLDLTAKIPLDKAKADPSAVAWGSWKGERIDAQQTDFTPIERAADFLPKPRQDEKSATWWIKREDKSVTGSHKFRSLVYQLSCLLDSNVDKAVLSSSGNAAIAASKLLPENAKLKLFVFLSKKTPPEKLAAIKFTKNLIPILSSRPLRLARYAIKHFNLKDLRPSKDPNAAIGFRSLGFEIFEQMPKVKNIFSFATSGASIRGIAQSYEFLIESGISKEMPQIFAVCSSGQLAGSLVAKSAIALAKAEQVVDKKNCLVDIEPALRSEAKDGWTRVDTSRQFNLSSRQRIDKKIRRVDISNMEILSAREKYPRLETSNEGLASLAAAEKVGPQEESLVILTGRIWSKKKPDLNKFFEAENFADVDKLMNSIFKNM